MGFYGKIYNTVKNTFNKIIIKNTGKDSYNLDPKAINKTIDIKDLKDFNLGFDSGNRWILLHWNDTNKTIDIYHQGTSQSMEDTEVTPKKNSAETSEGIIGGYTPPLLGGAIEDSPTGTSGETLENAPGEILDFNDTISLPVIYYDSTGHITKVGSKEYTMPDITELNGKIDDCVNEHEYIKSDITHIYGLIGATNNEFFNKSLIERVNSLERSVNTLQSQVPSNLEKTLETLAGNIATLKDSTSNTLTTLNGLMDDIRTRVAALEKTVEGMDGLKDAIGDGGGKQETPKTE